jgi:hypothetical protein
MVAVGLSIVAQLALAQRLGRQLRLAPLLLDELVGPLALAWIVGQVRRTGALLTSVLSTAVLRSSARWQPRPAR